MYINTRRLLVGMACILFILAIASLHRYNDRRASEIRQFQRAIMKSRLGAEDKSLLVGLADDERAWKSGLIHKIAGTLALKRIVWSADVDLETGRHGKLFLLDEFVRPTAGLSFPLLCVFTDNEFRLVAWKEVATWSKGYKSAQLNYNAGAAVLTVSSAANWFAGCMTYRYEIRESGIVDIPPERSEQRPEKSRAFNRDPEELKDILETLRRDHSFA